MKQKADSEILADRGRVEGIIETKIDRKKHMSTNITKQLTGKVALVTVNANEELEFPAENLSAETLIEDACSQANRSTLQDLQRSYYL
jgi:hypothetical protein